MGSIGAVLAESSGLVVAFDTTASSGCPMVAHLLGKWRRHSRSHTVVCVLAFDCPPGGWLAPPAVAFAGGIEKEVWVDCYSDPLGWDDDCAAAATKHKGPSTYLARDPDSITAAVRQAKKDVNDSDAWLVVIDSVSSMLLRFGTARAFQLLGELRAIFGVDNHPAERSSSSSGASSTMLALAHADVHDTWTVGCLEQMATTVLRFQPVDPPGSEQQRECEILNKRPSGRITLETQLFTVDEAGEVSLTKVVKAKKTATTTTATTAITGGSQQPVTTAAVAQTAAEKSPIDPAAGLTFSLTRTEQQEQDRQALILPHDQRASGAVQINLDDFADDDDDDDEGDDDDPDGDLDI